MRVSRHYVAAGGRTIHYRRAGEGPPVALFHESPRSSVALLPLMERLAGRFTVYGFDLPGFGNSDPLQRSRPEAADYADAFAAAFAALGLDKVPVYGTHTGAAVALELARLHPERVAVAILDGYPIFTPEEQENILRQYLPPFRPAWDGSHLATLWARVRDQYTFFPWFSVGETDRLKRDPPPLEHHQLVVMDYLRSGDHYRPAYAAAFRYDGVAAARAAASVPVIYMARDDDLLFPHLDRLPELPAAAMIQRLGADRGAWGEAIAGHMERHIAQAEPPPPDTGAPTLTGDAGAGPRAAFVELAHGPVHVRAAGGGKGRPVLLLHRIPGNARGLLPMMEHLGRSRPVFALDLFGTGESAPLPAAEPTLDEIAGGLLAVLDAIGIESCDVAGDFTGGPLALALAARADGRVRRTALLDPPPSEPEPLAALSERYVPDLTPDWQGRHLSAAWWWVRDALLYRPWFERRHANARALGPDVDVDALHGDFVAALLGAQGNRGLCRAAFERPIEALAADGPGQPVVIALPDGNAPRDCAAAIARAFEDT